MGRGPLKWAAGVTTVPARRHDLLSRTLASLRDGGWDAPRLFVDGDERGTVGRWGAFDGYEMTFRYPAVRTHGNFALSLLELFVRDPNADRFAMFQDDLLCVRNLRPYLDRIPFPARGYLNLYTFRENCPDVATTNRQTPLVKPATGWCGGWEVGLFEASQKGRGAVGLVFDREGVLVLLSSRHFNERPLDFMRGHRAVDGGVVTALNKEGFKEYCHYPSPLQHTGDVSSMGNGAHAKANSFPGEGFDALTWLPADTDQDVRR